MATIIINNSSEHFIPHGNNVVERCVLYMYGSVYYPCFMVILQQVNKLP